ncbi:hypothetical protein Bca101_005734 [Brassica carinata]
MEIPPRVIYPRRFHASPSQYTVAAPDLRDKLATLVDRNEKVKTAYHQLQSQIASGLAEERHHMDDTAQNGARSDDLNNQILRSKEENYAAKVDSARKEIVHNHKGQLRQLVHMLRQIETQVNSHRGDIVQMLDDGRNSFQEFIQKSLYYLSSVHSRNDDTFPATVKLLRILFNNINELLGSVDTGVTDLMQALSKNMCNPMSKYVGNLAADVKVGPCVQLMKVVNEMERANADTRRELEDARERIRLAEERKMEALSRLKKAEDQVQRMTSSARFLLPSSQEKQEEHSVNGKRICTEGSRESEEKLLWNLLSKRRKHQEPESPMGPKELIRQAGTKHKPLVQSRRMTRSQTRLSSPTGRPDALIPLGVSPSAARLLATLIVYGSGAVIRACTQAYRQALANASKSGVAQEAMHSLKRGIRGLTEPEARQILGVTEKSSWGEVLKTFFFVELDPQWAGICNGMAAGVMLAASFDLVNMLCITGCICDEV